MVEVTTNGTSFNVEKSLNGLMEMMEILQNGDPWSFTTVEVDDAIVFAGDALKTPFYNFGQSLNPYPDKKLILGTPWDDNFTIHRDDDVYVFTGPGDDIVNVLAQRSGEGGHPFIDGGQDFDTAMFEQSLGLPVFHTLFNAGEPAEVVFGNQLVSIIGGIDLVLDDSGGPIVMDFPVFPAF